MVTSIKLCIFFNLLLGDNFGDLSLGEHSCEYHTLSMLEKNSVKTCFCFVVDFLTKNKSLTSNARHFT